MAENKNISFYVILYVRGVGKIIIKCKIKKKLCSFPLVSNLCYLSCHLICSLPIVLVIVNSIYYLLRQISQLPALQTYHPILNPSPS